MQRVVTLPLLETPTPLFPNAKGNVSVMGGTTIGVTVNASVQDSGL
jgi:hypothetical protein